MGWAVTGCARKRCLLLMLWVWLATVGPSVGWRRVDLAWLLPVLLVGAGIVRQKATAIELVRTRGI